MANLNLFSALHRYYPREGTNPRENQITEMLAQVLSHEPEFCVRLLESFSGRQLDSRRVLIKTQVPFTYGTGANVSTKYLDMVVFEDTGLEIELRAVFENKWESGEHVSLDETGQPESQLRFYEQYVDQYSGQPKLVSLVCSSSAPLGQLAQ